MRDRIALVVAPGGYWGAAEAGIEVHVVEDPAGCAGTVRSLARDGKHGIVAVAEDAAGAGVEALAAEAAEAPPEVSVLLLPAPGKLAVEGLGRLRARFAAALGADLWRTAPAGGTGDG